LVFSYLLRWIVIAPNRKNIKGRFIEHVGYWSQRQGRSVNRQIVLNIPRIKYWISCGAVPTDRIQKFLALWNILPKPWYYKSKNGFIKKHNNKWLH
jgi:small subunit ribosomal protein S16